MNSTSTHRTERKRSRAGALLLLYLITAGAVGRSLPGMHETAEKLGAISVPLGLLCAGCWFAWKDGGWVARMCATVLALLTAGSFAFGVAKGIRHEKAARVVGAEFDKIRAGLAEDAADGSLGPQDARKHRERTQAAAIRMEGSDDAETAALGRVMETMSERTRGVEERLLAALDAVDSERFLKTDAIVTNNDFEWQKATAQEYGAAAKAVIVVHARLPREFERELSNAEIPKDEVAAFMAGFNRTWSLSGRVFHAHVKAATAAGALIAFLEKHDAEIEVAEDGRLNFQSDEDASAYNVLLEQTTTANADVNTAVEALNKAIAKH